MSLCYKSICYDKLGLALNVMIVALANKDIEIVFLKALLLKQHYQSDPVTKNKIK